MRSKTARKLTENNSNPSTSANGVRGIVRRRNGAKSFAYLANGKKMKNARLLIANLLSWCFARLFSGSGFANFQEIVNFLHTGKVFHGDFDLLLEVDV